jgi:hypothetical protein
VTKAIRERLEHKVRKEIPEPEELKVTKEILEQ